VTTQPTNIVPEAAGISLNRARNQRPALELVLARVGTRVRTLTTTKGRRRLRRPAWWGTLRRHHGFDPVYGQTRGTPVDRYYIEHMLDTHRELITGDVLEVNNREYVDRFGHDLASVTVLDIDATNPRATLVADLCREGSLPVGAFDCLVITQTLHFLPDIDTALRNLLASLKPGGTLLLTAPVASPTSWPEHPLDSWRFMPRGLEILAHRHARPGDQFEVLTFGNRVTVAAFVLSLALEDLRHRDLAPVDPLCPLLTALRFRRAGIVGGAQPLPATEPM